MGREVPKRDFRRNKNKQAVEKIKAAPLALEAKN